MIILKEYKNNVTGITVQLVERVCERTGNPFYRVKVEHRCGGSSVPYDDYSHAHRDFIKEVHNR